MSMHSNKIKISFTLLVSMGLISYGLSLSFLPTKTVYAYDYLINQNNNYDVYTTPNTPDKEYALQNIDCVVNFMQSYALISSSPTYSTPSSNSCSNGKSTAPTNDDDTSNYGSNQYQNAPPTGNNQQAFQQDTGIGIVKVISLNGSDNFSESPAQYSYAGHSSPVVTYQVSNNNENSGDEDNEEGKKVYNENTVTKEERKLLLKACFERAEDKGNYISSKEIKDCAENYNS
jgi:hypothetical protein